MHRSGGAKFTPPRSGKVLPRARVFLRIDAIPSPGALWIEGPPGSGKSTLVASYLERSGLTPFWYQLDAGDLDVGAFFSDLSLLARQAGRNAHRKLPRFTAEANLGLASYGRRFFRAWFAELREPFLLVFDNLQELPRDAPQCAALATAIEELPAVGRMVLISRNATPACYARLQASRLLYVLDDRELVLSAAETLGLAHLLLGKPVAPQFAERLHCVSEGWIAGIILLLECWRTGLPVGDGLPALRAEGAFDYFAHEILARLDKEVQQCLLKLGLLPTICPAVAEQLCESAAASRLLAELQENNCFVTSHTEPKLVYQFHAMFREFLQARAAAVFPRQDWNAVQVRAAALLEQDGQLDNAFRLYARAGDWAEAIRIVLTHAGSLAEQGHLHTLNEWLALLPEALVSAQPWLIYWRAASMLFSRPSAARAKFEEAHGAFARRGDPLGCALSSAGVIEAMLYEMGPSNRLDPWIVALEESLHLTSGFPSPGIEARVLISLFSASMIRQPGHPRMPAAVDRLLQVAAALEEVNLRLRAEHNVAWFRIFRGEVNAAFALLQTTRHLVRSAKPGPMAVITQHAIETWFAMLAGEHERCLEAGASALALARETGIHIWTPQVLGNSLASAIAADDVAAVERLSAEYSAESLERRPVDLAYQQCILAWRHATEGDQTLALRHQTVALDIAETIGMPFLQALSHLGLMHILLARGDPVGAENHLNMAGDVALRGALDVVTFPCLLAKAHLAFTLGQRARALEALRSALETGRAHGYMSAYWWQQTWVAELAEQALRAGIEMSYVQDLVRRRHLAPRAPPIDCPAWPWRVRLYTLGRLQLLVDERVVRFEGKTQRRPLELLLAVVAFRGREVPEERLFEALWPGSEPDKAHAALKSTVARLRELLGDGNAVRVGDGCLSLDARRCWVDTWAFERALSSTEAMLRADHCDSACDALDAAMALYRGPFLRERDSGAWSIELRERLRARLHRSLAAVGEALIDAGEYARVVHLHERALEADPLAEALHLGLMRTYDRLGRRPEAIEAYERCRRVLTAHGLSLSSQTEAARRAL